MKSRIRGRTLDALTAPPRAAPGRLATLEAESRIAADPSANAGHRQDTDQVGLNSRAAQADPSAPAHHVGYRPTPLPPL